MPDNNEEGAETRPNKVLYASASNKAVDDACRKLLELLLSIPVTDHLTIIRTYPLPGEKDQLVKDFRPESQRDNYVDELEATKIADEFYVAEFLKEVHDDQQSKTKQGDPRRVMLDHSLTHHMRKRLENHHDDNEDYSILRDYLKMDKSLLSKEQITQIKLLTNVLMKDTIRNADMIFCATSGANKVNLFENFDATVVIGDEAARATERSLVGFVAAGRPHTNILVADPNQMVPTVLTAFLTEYLKNEPVYINPFSPQLLLSGFTRLLLSGHPAAKLLEHHRCAGGLHQWSNRNFYNEEMVDYTFKLNRDENGKIVSKALRDKTVAARRYIKKMCPDMPEQRVKLNRVLINVGDSRSFKDTVSGSLTNPDTLKVVMDEIHAILTDPSMSDQHQTVLCLYKAQVDAYRAAIKKYTSEQQNRVYIEQIGEPRTGDGSQGFEDDIVYIDSVRHHGMGFTGGKHRLNVLMTRGRERQILVADVQGMMGGQTDKHLAKDPKSALFLDLIKDTEKNGFSKYVAADSSKCRRCQTFGHRFDDCPLKDACTNCNQLGHKARDCPTKPDYCKNCREEGHLKSQCPQRVCKKCGEKGHMYNACPQVLQAGPPICNRCGEAGHKRKDCTQVINTQFLKDIQDASYHQNQEVETHPDTESHAADSDAADDQWKVPANTTAEVVKNGDPAAADAQCGGAKTTTEVVKEVNNGDW